MLSKSLSDQSVEINRLYTVQVNIPQHILLKFTEIKHDPPTEERPNMKKMLIRYVFTQGSKSISLPLKYTNNRINTARLRQHSLQSYL